MIKDIKSSYNTSRRILSLFIISCLGFLIYSNTLYSPFVFDDHIYITENYPIRDLHNFLNIGGTRYVTLLSFAVNYAIGGYNVFGYHLLNILIHIANSILVYSLIIALFKTPAINLAQKEHGRLASNLALTASLLFLVHPIQTQAVSYITQRFASLATFFYLLSLLFYINARLLQNTPNGGPIIVKNQKINYWIFYSISLFFAVVAQKTKEICFTLPVIVIFCEFIFFKSTKGLRNRFLKLIPFLLLLAIIPLELFGHQLGLGDKLAGTAEVIREEQINELASLSSHDYFATQLRVILTYLRLLVLPVNQNVVYDYPVFHSFIDLRVFFSFIFLLTLFLSAGYLLKHSIKRQNIYGLLAGFGVIWFFVTISIESSIIPIKDVIFEHRVYLPSVGIIIAFSSVLFYIAEATSKHYGLKLNARWIALSVVYFIVTIFSLSTFKRNTIWNDNITFWQDVASKSPQVAIVQYNLGGALTYSNRLEEAVEHYQKALSLKPDYVDAHFNTAVVLEKLGRPGEAIAHYEQVLKLRPDHLDAFNNIATIEKKLGNLDKAIEYYKMILNANPDYLEAYNNLGNALTATGYFGEAATYFQEALKKQPDSAEIHFNFGNSLFKAGKLSEAVAQYRQALSLKPDLRVAQSNMDAVIKLMEEKGLRD